MKKQEKVLVISHDAGGAEIIAAYVKKHADKKEIHVYVAGPAIKIFKRMGISYKTIPNERQEIVRVVMKHAGVSVVLLGTGWMTKIEAWALEVAKERGIKTACYLESWVNYRERFGYPEKDWKKNLPDEIWVGDQYALALAEKYFSSHTKVRMVPNQYFKNIKARAKELRTEYPHPNGILFLSDAVPGVEQTLEMFLSQLVARKYSDVVGISLHPADPPGRYDAIIERYGSWVHIVHSRDLVRNLLSFRVVIGAETVALVVSVFLGKKTICIKEKGKHFLPFPKITYVRNTKNILRLI